MKISRIYMYRDLQGQGYVNRYFYGKIFGAYGSI